MQVKKCFSIKTLKVIVVACLLMSLLIPNVFAEDFVPSTNEFDGTYEQVAKTDAITMYADMNNGYFVLENRSNGYLWYSVPNDVKEDNITAGTMRSNLKSQLIVNYVDKEDEKTAALTKSVNSYMSSVDSNDVKVKKIKNGIRVTYGFSEIGMEIPVEYTISKDGFVATVLLSQIKEGKVSYLVSVNLLPSFGGARTGSDGYLFYPDGCGTLINFKEHASLNSTVSKPCYGNEKTDTNPTEKITDEQIIRMPVFGVVRENQNALFGIVEEGDAIAGISAFCSTDSCGYSTVSSVASYRYWDDKLMFKEVAGIQKTLYRVSKSHTNQKRYSVRYSMLTGEDANYVGMANLYRKYLTESKKINEKIDLPTFNLALYGSVGIDASFLGVHFTHIQKLTTYSQAKDIVEDISNDGVKSLSLRYIGWQKSGISNSKLVDADNISSKLGGKSKWKKLTSYLQENDFDFYPEVDLLSFQKNGGGITSKKNAIRNIFDDVAEQVEYSPSVYTVLADEKPIYLLKYSSLGKTVEKLLKTYKKTNVGNISVAKVGDILYSDFSDVTSYKEKSYKQAQESLKTLKKNLKKVAVAGGNAYALPYATKVYDTPIYSSGNLNFDEDVPFYQIALHGLVNMTTPSIMQTQDITTAFLKTVECGCELQFAGINEQATVLTGTQFDTLYNTTYSDWKEYAKGIYSDYKPVLNKIYNQKIIAHKKLSDNVYETEYANGIKVIVNYGSTDYEVNGTNVCSAKSFTEMGR